MYGDFFTSPNRHVKASSEYFFVFNVCVCVCVHHWSLLHVGFFIDFRAETELYQCLYKCLCESVCMIFSLPRAERKIKFEILMLSIARRCVRSK